MAGAATMAGEAATPRERMVVSAAQLVRAQGVAATGVREVIERSGAPRGSFQHYFPGGKDQLIGEALQWSADFAAGWVTRYRDVARTPSPAGLFAHMVSWWKQELAARDYERGCPVQAAAADVAADDSAVTGALRDAVARWERSIVEELVWLGVPRRRAGRLALLMLATLEGAIMLARIQRDLAPLDTAVTGLRPLLSAAATRG